MTREPTIADYSGDEGDGESGVDPESEDLRQSASGTVGREESDPDATVDPAGATYGWGSYDCAHCGSATHRVWRGEEGLVCPGCKEW